MDLLIQKPKVWFVLGESKHLHINVNQSLLNAVLLLGVLVFLLTVCLILHRNA